MLFQPLHAAEGERSMHAHEPVVEDPSLTWEQLIDAALGVHPRESDLNARAAEARAWNDRGRRWLAGTPSLYFSYLSDRYADERGQREYEGGIELPLWRPGERIAVRELAVSSASESDAARAALRLEVAGFLRAALWDIEAAANELAAAEEARAVAAELVRVVERRNAHGDLPLADVLLARAALLERDQAIVASTAELVDAERAYQSVTGIVRRPLVFREERSEREEFDSSHPLLALANAEVERARAAVEVADREARGNPAVSIGSFRQRDPLGTYYNDSVAVAVSVPIGGESRAATQRAQTLRVVGQAEAARGLLLRQLDLELHEAEHTLFVLEQSLSLGEERAALTRVQLEMAESAFTQGEIELRELLRIQDTAQTVAREVQGLRVERERTVAAYNQAIGELP